MRQGAGELSLQPAVTCAADAGCHGGSQRRRRRRTWITLAVSVGSKTTKKWPKKMKKELSSLTVMRAVAHLRLRAVTLKTRLLYKAKGSAQV
jgi:hypothetical protein